MIMYSYYIDSTVCKKVLGNNWNFNKIKWLIDQLKTIIINLIIFYFYNYYMFIYFIFNILIYFVIKNNNIKSLMIHLNHLTKKDLIKIKIK